VSAKKIKVTELQLPQKTTKAHQHRIHALEVAIEKKKEQG
jgi:hypothetical protein